MTIDFKKPKYILPLIVLPFIFLFFYVFQSWGASSKSKARQVALDSTSRIRVDQINTDMPTVSKDVAGGEIKDKFKALQETYKNNKDYSALAAMEGKDQKSPSSYTSAYSNNEIRSLQSSSKLDSLQRSLHQNEAVLDHNMQKLMNKRSGYPAAGIAPYNDRSAEALYKQIQRQSSPSGATVRDNSGSPDEMTVFREQMRLVDSMHKANRSDEGSAYETTANNKGKGNAKKVIDPLKDSTFKPLPVGLTPKNSSGFNTVRVFHAEESIKAILDQSEKGYAGTRVRIRLLQDIVVGDNTIPKSSYLYGVITGFQSQRVNISISQIMFEGRPLPVRLDVFDSDGYLGLYVPNSNFREFSKEIGTQGTSGLSSIQTNSGNTDVTTSLISKVFTTTTNSVNKLIRKDKAFLKYNYIIYLKEKER